MDKWFIIHPIEYYSTIKKNEVNLNVLYRNMKRVTIEILLNE